MSRPQPPKLAEVVAAVDEALAEASTGRTAVTRTSGDWARRKGVIVAMANGWNTTTPAAFRADWGNLITEREFDRRVAKSVVVPAENLQRQDSVKGRAY